MRALHDINVAVTKAMTLSRGGCNDDVLHGDDCIDQILGDDGDDQLFGDTTGRPTAITCRSGRTTFCMCGSGADVLYAFASGNNFANQSLCSLSNCLVTPTTTPQW